MIRIFKILLWLSMVAMMAMVWEGEGTAAPGDFLFQWGKPHILSRPTAVAVDSSGNTYTSEAETGRMLVFDANGKVIRTWGSYGSGIGQFSFVSALAIAGNLLYIAEAGNDRVQVFDTSGKFVRVLAQQGSGDGQVAFPLSVATDSKGNVYVADYGNNRVEIFDGTGNFVKAFTMPTEYEEAAPPYGIAVDGSGTIYVLTDYHLNLFDNTGKLKEQRPYYERIYVATDSASNVYLAPLDFWDDCPGEWVDKYDSVGTFVESVRHDFYGISGLCTDAKNNLYVADRDHNCIDVFDSEGKFLKKFGGDDGDGQFKVPDGVATDADGKVYVTDSANYRIQAFDTGGHFLKTFGRDQYGVVCRSYGGGPDVEYRPRGIAVDTTGKVYVGDDGPAIFNAPQGGNVRAFDSGGNFLQGWYITAEWNQDATPGGLALDSSGDICVADSYYNQIDIFKSDGTALRTWGNGGSAAAEISTPIGMARDSSGNLYVVDSGNKRIQVFNSYGTWLRSWGSEGSGDGQFLSPKWIAIDGSGNVYVTDYDETGSNSRVQVFDTQGKFRGKWGSVGSGDGQFMEPAGIASNASGSVVYVADRALNRVQAFAGYGSALPSGWVAQDIGSVGIKGRSDYANGTFTLQGSGADIYGASDAFQFVYQPLTGNGQIVARVVSIKNTSAYAKAGIMIRQSLSANAVHATMDLKPTGGAEFSRRSTTGGSTTVTSKAGIAAPYWVKLVRNGSTITGSVSADGSSWTQVGSATVAMTGPAYVGLIVNSHNNSALCTAVLDSVSITTGTIDSTPPAVTAFSVPSTSTSLTVPITNLTATDNVGVAGYLVTESATRPAPGASGWTTTKPSEYTLATTGTKTLYAWAKDAAGNVSASRSATVTVTGGALPAPWLTQDVGSVGVTGSAAYANGSFTVKGSGADIWGSSDAFRFVYKTMIGDGEIIARVASLQNTNSYAKGGVMIRQSLAANSMHAMMDLKPSGGAEFSRRTSTGGTTSATLKSTPAAPYWVRLKRSGNSFTGSVSSDGVTWTQVGSATINMTGSVYVGLIVTSHNNATLCSTTIDNVK